MMSRRGGNGVGVAECGPGRMVLLGCLWGLAWDLRTYWMWVEAIDCEREADGGPGEQVIAWRVDEMDNYDVAM